MASGRSGPPRLNRTIATLRRVMAVAGAAVMASAAAPFPATVMVDEAGCPNTRAGSFCGNEFSPALPIVLMGDGPPSTSRSAPTLWGLDDESSLAMTFVSAVNPFPAAFATTAGAVAAGPDVS